ncbi:MAG: hypothetical protein J6A80_02655 [Lachnospiraceae bacterium]|nr:hypothetical protein [Lachnospiraceae bacterium]
MNRNFEEAYKAEVQQNIPDLWNRIESGLPEKEVQTNLNHRSNKKKKNPYAWMKWASLAAAAMLVIILIPTLLGIGALLLMSDKSSSTDMAMNESVAEQMVTTDGMAEEDVKLESADVENMAETPAINQDYADSERAEGEMAEESIMGAEPSSDVLSDVQSAESESEYPWELYADGLYVKVISATATQDGYAVELELYKLHDNLAGPVLENSPYYDNGIIQANVYNGEGEVPVVGEKYTATLYGIPEQYSLILPFKAVLELKE